MSLFLLDTTVLVSHLREDPGARDAILRWVGEGHHLCISCITIAEVERGTPLHGMRTTRRLLERFGFLVTDREAARRAGRYQADWRAKGRTLDLGDALIAGTARAFGATLVTANVRDFPMRDIRIMEATFQP